MIEQKPFRVNELFSCMFLCILAVENLQNWGYVFSANPFT